MIPTTTIEKNDADILLTQEEAHFLDFKSKRIAPAKLSRSISSFANTSGGDLYIGIEDRTDPSNPAKLWNGFASIEDANQIIESFDTISPHIDFLQYEFISCHEYEGYILHITISKSRDIIKSTSGKIYIRRSANIKELTNTDDIRRLEYNKGIASYEDATLNIPTEEISSSTNFSDFIKNIIPHAEPLAWLKKQNLITQDKPTVAATLLFAEEPQSHLSKQSAIKILQYKTRSADADRDTLAFTPLTIEGNLYTQIYAAVSETKKIIEQTGVITQNDIEAKSYPEETLHEIVTNAVIHRDYSIQTDIQIRIFDNRIEVESPGKLPGHITTINILDEQWARNGKIVRIINKFPNPPNKDVGEGLNTAFEAMRKMRLKPPTIEEKETSVLVTIKHEPLASPEELVLEHLEKHEEITNAIARELTGIPSENAMKNVFYRLRDRSMIEQVPGKKGNLAAWRKSQKPAK